VFLELCDALKSCDKLDLVVIDTVRGASGQIATLQPPRDEDIVCNNNYVYESYILLCRNLKNIIRTKELFIARIGAVIGFGFLIGSLFYRRPETDTGVTERVAYLVFAIAFFCYTSLESLPIFLAEREIFQREYSRGSYRAISYVTAVSTVYLPFLLVLGFMFAIPSYWLVMLPNDAETFFFYIFALLCTNIAAQSFAVLVSVLVPDPMAGQSAGSGLFSVMFLLSGFFITKDHIPDWWSWLHYLSLFKYAYESMVINILLGKIETPTSTNEEIMIRFSVNNVSKWRGIGVLLGYSIFYRFIFYVVLVKYYNGRRKE
jgi:ABC-type multidrug transport system permease subunit